MSGREFIVLLCMCLIWGFHFVVLKWALADLPALHYAAIRMVLVAALLAPFLKWRREQMPYLIIAGVCLGGANYALMFTGLQMATASASAVAVELYTPFVTILSVIFLRERIGLPRLTGIAMALIGVLIISLSKADGDASGQAFGVGLVAAAVMLESVGAILIKRWTTLKPIELLAWFALVGAIFLSSLATAIEPGGWQALADAPRDKTILAILYSAVGGSIIGHTSYYWLIKRLPISMVAPSALLTTVIAVFFSVMLLGEPLSLAFLIGGALTMAGVGIILFRSGRAAPEPGARGAGFLKSVTEETQE